VAALEETFQALLLWQGAAVVVDAAADAVVFCGCLQVVDSSKITPTVAVAKHWQT
jgi:hypothetical protein